MTILIDIYTHNLMASYCQNHFFHFRRMVRDFLFGYIHEKVSEYDTLLSTSVMMTNFLSLIVPSIMPEIHALFLSK